MIEFLNESVHFVRFRVQIGPGFDVRELRVGILPISSLALFTAICNMLAAGAFSERIPDLLERVLTPGSIASVVSATYNEI
jgi:hypothetical protein